jgi:hypothetical protein
MRMYNYIPDKPISRRVKMAIRFFVPTVAVGVITIVVFQFFMSSNAPAQDVQVASVESTLATEEEFDVPVCDLATAQKILTIYNEDGPIPAREVAENALADGICTSEFYNFYSVDYANESEIEVGDSKKFSTAECSDSGNGECIALQPVFYYEDDDSSKERREGYTLLKHTLTTEGNIEDWTNLSF